MPQKEKVPPSYFTNAPEVVAVIRDLEARFGPAYEKLVVSDVLDDKGRQYVNLVQEGGGVLGVALVGYTYILEKAGIRFMRLAGTSAGAINTTLLAVVAEKDGKTSSERILEYLGDKDFFEFVDGHPFAKTTIKRFFRTENFSGRVKNWLRGLGISLVALLLLDILSLWLRPAFPIFNTLAKISFIATGVLLLATGAAGLYLRYLLQRFKNRGFGINPGRTFTDWIKMIMAENGVHTIADLDDAAKKMVPPDSLRLRRLSRDPYLAVNPLKDMQRDITLITSEIITQNKIEFPRMWNLFRERQEDLHPAEFVRASMSIPIFFESHIIRDIPRDSADVQAAWDKHLLTQPEDIPLAVRFVDGGVLSNFPINIFYNPKITVPRLPTFGIELDDSEPKPPTKDQADKLSLGGYLGKLFNTVRYYYDKDFLLKNNLFKKGIGHIRVYQYNWLDFNISNEKQRELFVLGAQAAGKFLMEFNWNEYMAVRIETHEKINEPKPVDGVEAKG
ncbi:patatin-like phospholipase family protein [Chitinophaga lutea]